MKKTILILSLSLFAITTIFSCKDTKKNTTKSANKEIASSALKFKNPEIMKIFQLYLQIEKALENDNKETTTSYALEMTTALKSNFPRIASIADKISQVSSLQEQRMAFAELSNSMEEIISGNLTNGKLYKQYCPMANDNNGAYWLSTIKEINNPYMGKSMPHCGKTESVIE